MSDNRFFQHHFVDSTQQYEASKIGMWAFLVTEVLTFAGFFCAYAIFRAWDPNMFINAHKALDITMGATNTVVLITSSLTMALAIRYIQLNNNKAAIFNLILTLLFAGTFLIIKYFEYNYETGSYYKSNKTIRFPIIIFAGIAFNNAEAMDLYWEFNYDECDYDSPSYWSIENRKTELDETKLSFGISIPYYIQTTIMYTGWDWRLMFGIGI